MEGSSKTEKWIIYIILAITIGCIIFYILSGEELPSDYHHKQLLSPYL